MIAHERPPLGARCGRRDRAIVRCHAGRSNGAVMRWTDDAPTRPPSYDSIGTDARSSASGSRAPRPPSRIGKLDADQSCPRCRGDRQRLIVIDDRSESGFHRLPWRRSTRPRVSWGSANARSDRRAELVKLGRPALVMRIRAQDLLHELAIGGESRPDPGDRTAAADDEDGLSATLNRVEELGEPASGVCSTNRMHLTKLTTTSGFVFPPPDSRLPGSFVPICTRP